MSLSDFLNGAGPFVAISALPMLAGLLVRRRDPEGRQALAAQLRSVAIFLALGLPLLFMALTVVVYLPTASRAPFDFEVNYQAATALYRQGANPYSVHAAYSFPFPTFYLYWLGSAFGLLNEPLAWVAWWLTNGVIWLLCVMALWRSLPAQPIRAPHQRDMLLYAAVAIPATTVLWQGQTALFILAGLVALHSACMTIYRAPRMRWIEIIGGAGLAFAALIKPQIALVGFGVMLWGFLALRSRQYDVASRAMWIILSAVMVAIVLIGLTLILPGGVTLDTYRHFISDALPQVARPADSILVIGSPAFTAAVVALGLGASDATADLVANVVTLLVLALAIAWTFRRANRPVTEIAAGWGVWAMVAPRVTWTWYAAWCLPFFVLAVLESGPRRLALFALTLGLLNLQLNIAFVPLATILLLIGLLWTSFAPERVPAQEMAHA